MSGPPPRRARASHRAKTAPRLSAWVPRRAAAAVESARSPSQWSRRRRRLASAPRRRSPRRIPTPAPRAPSARGSDPRPRRAATLAAFRRVRVGPGSPSLSLPRPIGGTARRRCRGRRKGARWSDRSPLATSAPCVRAPEPPCRECFRIVRRPRRTRPSSPKRELR